jgi:hypothetical protein
MADRTTTSTSDLAYRITTTRYGRLHRDKVYASVKTVNMLLLQQHLTRVYTSGGCLTHDADPPRQGHDPVPSAHGKWHLIRGCAASATVAHSQWLVLCGARCVGVLDCRVDGA